MGYSTGRSSSENLAGRIVTWLDSPAHYANLINSNWTHVGVGTSGGITVALFMNGRPLPIEPTPQAPPQSTTTMPPDEAQTPSVDNAPATQPSVVAPPQEPTEPQVHENCWSFDWDGWAWDKQVGWCGCEEPQ